MSTVEHEQRLAAAELASQTRWRVGVIVVTAVVVLAVGLLVSRFRGGADVVYRAVPGEVAMPAAVLTDTDGEPYDLAARTAGAYTLLFFGYTSCPDACPIQMAVLGAAFDDLRGDVIDDLTVVFVSTDPDRDTPAVIRSYLDQFDASFVGLTGTADELRDVQFAAGVPAATVGVAEDDGDYLVGHATQVLLFDRDGIAQRVYPLGVRQGDWVTDLSDLVGGDGA